MKNLLYTILITLLFSMPGCRTDKGKDLLKYCVENRLHLEGIDRFTLILIPFEGCQSCLGKIENFMAMNSDTSIYYIVSSYFEKDRINSTKKYGSGNIYYDP